MNEEQRDAAILEIAKKHLHRSTLETRQSDRLDFSDQSVWSLKAALEAAFAAGCVAGKTEACDYLVQGLRNDRI